MKTNFPVGLLNLHKKPDLNFQLNRMIILGGAPAEEVSPAAGKIRDLKDWVSVFLSLGEKALSEGRNLHASAFFRGAEFFMNPSDPRKIPCYEKSIELFRRAVSEDFEEGLVIPHKIPFENAFLPAWHLPAKEKKGVIVLHGGFDSCMEELYSAAARMRNQGYDLILFEGPGQGSALRLQKLKMTPCWEKPVGAVLDHFNLNDVTLVGLSLGGYLAPRAAAFEPRIRRVVAWDVMYDFFEVLTATQGRFLSLGLKSLLALKAESIVNRVAELRMKGDTMTEWGINHGMYVMGAETPFEFFEKARLFSLKKISGSITQDFLLMAGTEDHFFDLGWFYKQAKKLVNVRSFTGRIFTRSENGQDHCQLGNLNLAISFIAGWLDQLDNS